MRLGSTLLCVMTACASAPIDRLDPEEVLGAARGKVEPIGSVVLLERLQRFVDDFGVRRYRALNPQGVPRRA